jgi:hypothetical protein
MEFGNLCVDFSWYYQWMPNGNSDLGLGDRVVEQNQSRFLNPDGSFNVYRKGVFERGSFSPYHALLSMSWTRFYSLILGSYIFANFVFTGLYLLCGRGAFPAIQDASFIVFTLSRRLVRVAL